MQGAIPCLGSRTIFQVEHNRWIRSVADTSRLGSLAAYHRVIVVYVDPDDQIRRLRERDARGAAEIAGILAAQWPLGDKAARADDVVDNRGSLAETRKRVRKIWAELQKIGKSS